MRPEDFDLFVNTVKQRSGLLLTADKAHMLESRLPLVARKWNFETIDELAHAVRTGCDENLMGEIAEAMTNNESFFFRDQYPFDQLRKLLLPQFLQARAAKKQIRIWSAASSSGQEAYSIAMICADAAAALQGWKIDIIGTDISNEMVERAKTGVYSQFEVQRGLPISMLVRYFQQKNEKWQIKDSIQQMVQFRAGNLLQDFGAVGVFDIIFCRNVLIYFDPPTKARVLTALASVLAADGVLFLGGAETVFGITDKFRPMENERGIYALANTAGGMRAVG